MNVVPALPASAIAIAIATASALSGCAIPTAETMSPFQEPWPWQKVVAVNHTDHDVRAVRAGRCETGPALRHSRSSPSFCFLGTKPGGEIAITWSEARSDTDPGSASDQGTVHASRALLPRLWDKDAGPDPVTGSFLCVVLHNEARVRVAVAASASDCALAKAVSGMASPAS